MANEIKVTASLECSKGNFKLAKQGGDIVQISQTGVGGGVPGQVNADTTGVDVTLSALSTYGWVRMVNLDSTNYVQFGPKSGGTFYPVGRMKAGEPALFRIEPGITLHLKANTAACKVLVQALED